MKIMKIFNSQRKDVTYHKYRINLPKKIVENSGLLDAELMIKIENGKITIEKKPAQQLTEREKIIQKELMKLLKKSKKE